jgi:hypothetical protein
MISYQRAQAPRLRRARPLGQFDVPTPAEAPHIITPNALCRYRCHTRALIGRQKQKALHKNTRATVTTLASPLKHKFYDQLLYSPYKMSNSYD